jgi:hypothetical protein
MVKPYKAIRSFSPFVGAGIVAVACSFVSCSDPVRSQQIAALGGEDPAVPTGPLHRPGQPCVLCHSSGGPASGAPFAVAGTIFETNAPDSMGATGVSVLFIDAASSQRSYDTNEAGNFFIPESEWSDLTFPFKVGLLTKDGKQVAMNSTVNREGSCNFCHRPVPMSPLALPTDDPRSSIPQIFVAAAAAGGAP